MSTHEDDQDGYRADPAVAKGERRHEGARVLLVEDSEINQEIVAEMLGDLGLLVTTADDGAEALSTLLSAPRIAARPPFDLVLMDVQMPVMDGLAATRAIRALPEAVLATLPVVALTASTSAEDREKSFSAGMNDHLSKPFEPEAVLGVLDRWLRRGGS